MKVKRYPSYKTGLSKNISLLPEHWAELPLKRLFRLEKREPLESDEIVTAFRDGTVTLRKNRREDGFTNALKEIGYQRIHRNDLVIHAMDAFAGAIGVSDADGKSSPVYSACTATQDANPCFYAYYLRDLALRGFIESLAKGVRERSTDFRWSGASMVAVPVPPQSEQLAIASFLDRETAKIDALIAEQQRLIELLQEKRQAVISHAVTKGLNPNAPMKDSGVEWLGEVPEHWTICPLKHFCKITTGFAFKSDEFQDEGIPLVRISDIQSDGTVDLKDAKYLKESELIDHPRETLKHGDIAMAMTGGTIGKAGIYSSSEPALLNQRVCIFRAKPDCSQAFLWLITASRFYQEHIKLSSFGGAQPNISDGDLLACICPIPPLAEQEEISAFIDSQAAKLGELKRKAESTIELLNERRSALISAAVIGQIDVRGLATEEEP
jgi:type I restriction enzyme S subunit